MDSSARSCVAPIWGRSSARRPDFHVGLTIHRQRPKSRRLDALNLELLLSAEEAARGGVVVLGVPVFYPCRACHGAGVLAADVCQACDGRGMVEEEEDVRLAIPAFVRDGTVLRVPLRGLGIHNMYLHVFIRVGE